MQAKLYNQEGKESGEIELPDAIFNVRWNAALVKQVVDAEQANRRKPTAHTKMRGEVRGGGKKPWKQKGTGRARHGSTRSPLWKGGGTTFGPRAETVFAKKINKKMKRKALFMVLSAKTRDGECYFVDQIDLVQPKTREFSKIVGSFKNVSGKSLALVSPGDALLERAARNIKGLWVYSASQLNALDLLQKKFIFMPKSAVAVVEKTFLK